MRVRTQRVKQLRNEFMRYHNDGYSIHEIAERFKVEETTVYNNLQAIADANGVTRESLLQVVKKGGTSRHRAFAKEVVDVEKLNIEFEKTNTDIQNVISYIDEILEKTKE